MPKSPDNTPPSPPYIPTNAYVPKSPDNPPSPDFPPPNLFNDLSVEATDDKLSNDDKIKRLLKIYFVEKANFSVTGRKTHEFEVRFGTQKYAKKISKNDFENVIRMVKNSGFSSENESGSHSLKMTNEYMNRNTGTFMQSNTRVEINSIHGIQTYCKSERFAEFVNSQKSIVTFVKKTPAKYKDKNLPPINVPDYNFRVSCQFEEQEPHEKTFIAKTFQDSKKIYRLINRITFKHPEIPFKLDLSIVKSSKNHPYTKYYNLSESELFTQHEVYEIEIEAENDLIGKGNKHDNFDLVYAQLRKVIKIIISGLQRTRYPISYPEQEAVLKDYMKLLYKTEFNPQTRISAKHFIGPSSQTLLMKHMSSEVSGINFNEFVVTEKADGERCLLYINNEGRIYLITQNMGVIFTGTKSQNKDTWNSCLDGELILHDKLGRFINLYAAFDIYYLRKEDIRHYPFLHDKKDKIKKSRYMSLKTIVTLFELTSVITSSKSPVNVFVPLRITCKKFFPETQGSGVLSGCKTILDRIHNDMFEYKTDGLILSPMYFGVGSDKVGTVGPKTKMTWDYSFKWKPPEQNTIDFMVDFAKDPNTSMNVVKTIADNGSDISTNNFLSEYQQLHLLCSYNEKKDGPIYINPYEDVLNGVVPDYKTLKNLDEDRTSKSIALRFYPKFPADADAGVCNILLQMDKDGTNRLFTEENEPIENHSIVEFSYDMTKKKEWRWTPLRVRHDKMFGNALTTANNNWESIHNPISEEMIRGEEEFPDLLINDDVYYNKEVGIAKTQPMKDFHNLYVKRKLLSGVSKKGDMLIDYACGKGGDISKWISNDLSFIFGIDLFNDNIENRNDGVCVRYLESHKKYKAMPMGLFVNGDSSLNIKRGTAAANPKAGKIMKSVFGLEPKDETLGRAVLKTYGKVKDGFQISSCQFALHYFFRDGASLKGFMTNLSECTKLGGYFVGATYDGKKIFNDLKQSNALILKEDDRRLWEVQKHYTAETFEDDSSSIGYRISVYQDSINQEISEFLVNYEYLQQVMEDYGFVPISDAESNEIGFPHGVGTFRELYSQMQDEIRKNSHKRKEFKEAPNMTENQKTISFYNRYFIYKKIRDVNPEKVAIEIIESKGKSTIDAPKLKKKTKRSSTRLLTKLNVKLIIEDDDDE